MYYKIVNRFDVDCLEDSISQNRLMIDVQAEIKEKVTRAIRDTIAILDEYYGETRLPERDLGGFLIFLPTVQDTQIFYDKILKHFNLDIIYAEIDDEIVASDKIMFRLQIFNLSSDYSLVIVYPSVN